MKRKMFVIIALVLVLAVSFSVFASARQQVQQRRLFDEDGNEVFGGSVFYDEDRVPIFGPGCWYWSENGRRVDARGMDAFMYDDDGNLVPAPYGSWCRGWNGGGRGTGRGCCRWRY